MPPSARTIAAGTAHQWLVLLAAACLGLLGQAQPVSPWRTFRAADGLAESLTTAVTVSPRGNVWVKHGDIDSVSLLDGYSIRHVAVPNSRTFRIYEGWSGRVWSGSPLHLLEYAGDQWAVHPIAEMSLPTATPLGRIPAATSLVPAEQDRVLMLLPERLVEYRAISRVLHVLRTTNNSQLGRFRTMTAAYDGGLWIAGDLGIARVPGPLRQINSNSLWKEHIPPAELQIGNLERLFEDDEGGVTGLAFDASLQQRVVLHFDGTNWLTRSLPEHNLRFAWRGVEPGHFWGATMNGLFEWRPNQLQPTQVNLGVNQYFDVAVQPRGVFWLATLDGLMRYSPPVWRPEEAEPTRVAIHACLEDARGRLWLATAKGIAGFSEGRWQEWPWPNGFEPVFRTRDGLYDIGEGRIALDASEQFWLLDTTARTWTPIVPSSGRVVRKVLLQDADHTLCVQTAEPGAAAGAYQFERFDGLAFSPWPQAPPPIDLGSSLFFLARARNGALWMGGTAGVALWQEGAWQRFGPMDGYAAEGAFHWIEHEDGRIWCATVGKVLEYAGKNWSVVLRGTDRIGAMIPSHDASTWIATGSGLYRFVKETWAGVDEMDGLPSGVCLALLEDRSHRLWVGTSRGLARYYPQADADPPRTLSVTVEQLREPSGEYTAQAQFRGRDRWGATPDERLLYSCRLDSAAWSPFGRSPLAVFRNVSPGTHRIEVRALDRNWNFEPRMAAADFQIILPWYREWRIVSVAIVGLSTALFFAALAVNRHLRLRRSYAEVERKVQQRTHELQRAMEALAHSQKMTALGTLAAGIAHDFNNILSIIKGSAQIIGTHLDDRDKVLTRVSRIQTMVDQASGIVRAMLGFGRFSEKQLGPCDLQAVVDQTLRILGDQFRRDVPVHRDVEPNLPLVWGALPLIQQSLLNLVLNAADALAPGGWIRVSAHRLPTIPPNLVLAPADSPDYVALVVQDNGTGIRADILPRIFEPFFSTKAFSARRGTGLGLYMVYEFAREMGHGILVESEVGQGTAFTLVLPVARTPGRA